MSEYKHQLIHIYHQSGITIPKGISGKMKNIRRTYTLQRLKENQTKLLRTNILSVKKAIYFTSDSHI